MHREKKSPHYPMANETERNDGTEGRSTAELRFGRGDTALDRESNDDARLIVLERHDVPASEKYITAINATVAEANPEYPDDDAVVSVAFVESVEDALGLSWEVEDVLEVYDEDRMERARIKRYAYPESRLAPTENGGSEG